LPRRVPQVMLDTLWSGAGGPAYPELLRRHAYVSMIETAQNVADLYGLTREEIDAFALRSHNHAARARDSGRLAEEIVPVTIPATRQTAERVFEHDETIRDDTTLDSLADLPAQPGTTQMTAGNSTPLSDGSSAVVIASADTVAKLGVAPLARIVGSALHALEPGLMGIAPAWAMTKVIKAAGIAPEDVGVWEGM
jgi:acetyl-CoA acetyltransferase